MLGLLVMLMIPALAALYFRLSLASIFLVTVLVNISVSMFPVIRSPILSNPCSPQPQSYTPRLVPLSVSADTSRPKIPMSFPVPEQA